MVAGKICPECESKIQVMVKWHILVRMNQELVPDGHAMIVDVHM